MEENNNLWNVKKLEPPPISTYKVIAERDVTPLLDTFQEAINFFTNQKHLEAESALLSRFIYRMKMKFRCDKGFKVLLKLNRCLLQYLHMNFVGTVTGLYEVIPKKKSYEVYMPSRNMFDFILVRLQGLIMLLSRTCETSQLAADFMENKMFLGDFWKVALIMFAIVSRIWTIVKRMMEFCYPLYVSILEFRKSLKIIGTQWLPKNYKFPDNLEEWLKVHRDCEVNKPTISQNIKETCMTDISNEVQIEDEKQLQFKAIRTEKANFYSMLQNDIGELVKRPNDTSQLSENNELKEILRFNGNQTRTLHDQILLKDGSVNKRRIQGKNKLNILKNVNDELIINAVKVKNKKGCAKNIIKHSRRVEISNGLERGNFKNSHNNFDQSFNEQEILPNYFQQHNVTCAETKPSVAKENDSDNILQTNQNYKTIQILETEGCYSIEKNNLKDTAPNIFNESKILDKINKKQNKRTLPKNTKCNINNLDHVLKRLNSLIEVKQFMKTQSTCRNKKKDCISSKLDKLQWHILNKEMKKHISKANKAVHLKIEEEKYLLKAKTMLKLSLS